MSIFKKFLTHIDMGGNRLANLSYPGADTDAVNKHYVDGKVKGFISTSGGDMTGQLSMDANIMPKTSFGHPIGRASLGDSHHYWNKIYAVYLYIKTTIHGSSASFTGNVQAVGGFSTGHGNVKFHKLTQSQYNALHSKDSSTLYIIV